MRSETHCWTLICSTLDFIEGTHAQTGLRTFHLASAWKKLLKPIGPIRSPVALFVVLNAHQAFAVMYLTLS